MTSNKVPNPNGHQNRVEALVVGFWPMIVGFGSLIVAATSLGAYIAIELYTIRSAIQDNGTDRWTRSNTIELCWELEGLNPGFKCPKPLPKFVKQSDVISFLKVFKNVAKADSARVKQILR